MKKDFWKRNMSENSLKNLLIPRSQPLTPEPDEYHVVYDRYPEQSSVWYQVMVKAHEKANSLFTRTIDNVNTFEQVGNFLISMAKEERNREIKLFEKLGIKINSELEITDFIKEFNKILIGKKEFEKASERLRRALQKNIEDPTKGAQAPLISSLYFGEYVRVFTAELHKIIDREIKSGAETFDVEKLRPEIEDAFIDSIKKAFISSIKNFNKSDDKGIYGDKGDYDDILKALKQMENSTEYMEFLVDRISSRLNIDNLIKKMKEEVDDIYKKRRDNKRKRDGLNSLVKKAFAGNNKNFASQLGGSHYEVISLLEIQKRLDEITIDVLEGKASTKMGAMSSETQKIDGMLMLTFDETDINETVNDMLKEMYEDDFKSLVQASEKISKFTSTVLNKMNEGFIIYESAKAYSMGRSFNGFQNDSNRSLKQLPDVAANFGKRDEAKTIVAAIYNAIPGAALQGRVETLKEEARKLLAEGAAYLLFDDWEEIAQGASEYMTKDVLHVFALSGVYVPLSVVLNGMGEAYLKAKNIRSWFSSQIRIRGRILYDDWRQYQPYIDLMESRKGGKLYASDINKEWDHQREEAEKQVTFSTHFLSGFRQLIAKVIDFNES